MPNDWTDDWIVSEQHCIYKGLLINAQDFYLNKRLEPQVSLTEVSKNILFGLYI